MTGTDRAQEAARQGSVGDPGGQQARSATGADFGHRVLGLVSALRIIVATILFLIGMLGIDAGNIGYRYPDLYLLATGFYMFTSVGTAALLYTGKADDRSLALVQLLIDILLITLIVHASGGVRSGIEGLLAIFVAAVGLTLPRRSAYLTAALAAIAILIEQTVSYSQGMAQSGDFVQVGILGAIMMAVALGTQPLLRRIEETEALARQRGIDLANLAQLNDYIIQNLRESIVVVDERNRIRLLNQSGAKLLGTDRHDTGRGLRRLSPDLAALVDDWRNDVAPEGGTPSFTGPDGNTEINTYIAPLGPDNSGPALLFLEDASLLTDKVQQSKLAALGRLSASIAHEIRNPIGALSHAGQLLAESENMAEEEQRFLKIIQTNCNRVSDIVDNVLQLSRKEAAKPELISLQQWCKDFAQEFTDTLQLNEGELSVAPADEDVMVRMDPGHLHQVAWNLCENAVKYASQSAGGIAVVMRFGRRPNNKRPYLDIVDQGSGVPEHLQENLFEPFATGREGGTGLGLYISRELCEQNKAQLRYVSGDDGGSVFQIVFADPSRWEL